MEDVVNVHQRAKVEEYDGHLFLVVRVLLEGEKSLVTEQVSLFLGGGVLVTFQEHRDDPFDPVRERLRKGKGRIRAAGADYLAYALLDTVVDSYFPLLESLGDRLQVLEDEILDSPGKSTVAGIYQAKRDLLLMRRSIWPLREAISALLRGESDHVSPDTLIYLRDCYDHVVMVLDMVESYRDMTSGLMDFYLSSVSNRMNDVMRVLTVIATIFIPLTFVAGIYGMNFNPEASPYNMPELSWRWGYPAFWGVMVSVAVGMLIFFRRKGWLGGGE
jgi:magnesium transporter